MFVDNVIWTTGASSGIGEGLVRRFAAEGAAVVLSSRNEAELGRVADDCAGAGADSVLVLPLDVTDTAAMPAAVDAVLARFGRLDMLVNNAGIGQRSLCADTDLDVYRRLFEVDVMGPIALTKAVLPSMIERNAGHIVITSSVAGKVGVPLRTGYCMAKHAVMGFFDALRTEVAHHGVKVSTLVPGVVRTNVVANALGADGEPLGPEVGVMEEGIEVDECVDIIVTQLARGADEIEAGRGPEMGMLEMKRNDPVATFRAIEAMAAQLFEGNGS